MRLISDLPSKRLASARPWPQTASGPQLSTLWRFALPGVCRLVSDPATLERLVARHPDARVARLMPEPAC